MKKNLASYLSLLAVLTVPLGEVYAVGLPFTALVARGPQQFSEWVRTTAEESRTFVPPGKVNVAAAESRHKLAAISGQAGFTVGDFLTTWGQRELLLASRGKNPAIRGDYPGKDQSVYIEGDLLASYEQEDLAVGHAPRVAMRSLPPSATHSATESEGFVLPSSLAANFENSQLPTMASGAKGSQHTSLVTKVVAPVKALEPSRPIQPSQHVNAAEHGQNLDAEKTIVFFEERGKLFAHPEGLEFSRVGEKATVSATLPTGSLENFFVRDENVVTWDRQTGTLTSIAAGKTELYFVYKGQMKIISITSGSSSDQNQALQVPEGLATISEPRGAANQASMGSMVTPPGLSVVESEAEAAVAQEQAVLESGAFVRPTEAANWKSLHVQLIDDRSSISGKAIFPVEGVEVKVLGTKFALTTNATGHIYLRDVPVDSRFIIQARDPTGRYLPLYTEVYAGPSDEKTLVRIKMVRERMVSSLATLLGTAVDSRRSTLCGQVTREDGSGWPGLEVRINTEADGIVYFGDFGPDLQRGETSASGRFCLLNLAPQLVDLDFYAQDSFVGSFAVPVVGGSHMDELFALNAGAAQETHLAVVPTAHEAIYGEPGQSSRLREVDYADLITLGDVQSMEYRAEGVLTIPEAANYYRSRIFAVANAAEFEPVLYSYNAGAEGSVTSLIPRGFIEDLYTSLVETQGNTPIAYDPALGALLVDYGHHDGYASDNVEIKVMDSFGRDITSGWYYSDSSDVSKAVYFNLESGLYTVMVQGPDERWLAVDTVVVDRETVSLAQLGSQPKLRNIRGSSH